VVNVCLRLGFLWVLIVQDLGEIAADHQQRRERFARGGEGTLAIMDRLLKVALTRCYDSESDAGFGEPHGARSLPSKSVLAWMTSLASIPAKPDLRVILRCRSELYGG
jgi:hypothetical protein